CSDAVLAVDHTVLLRQLLNDRFLTKVDLAGFTFDLYATELSHVLDLLEGDLLAQDRPNVLDVLVVLAHAENVVDVQQEVHFSLPVSEQARVVFAGHKTTPLQYSRDM